MKLKEYWSVTTMFYDDGKVKVYVGSTLSAEKPSNAYLEAESCDSYRDWFNTEKEARAFAAEAKRA